MAGKASHGNTAELKAAIAMHQHGRPYVAAHQPIVRQVAGQCHGVQFVDRVLGLLAKLEDLRCVVGEDLAGGGQADAGAEPFKQG